MGDRKSEAGSRVEAPQKKKPTPTPIMFLLQHSSAPDFWLLGSSGGLRLMARLEEKIGEEW
jgi:hypothetical protein